MVDRAFVLQKLDDASTLLINTLSEADFRGEEPSRYGRPGRIPGSVNLPWPGLVDPTGMTFVPPKEAARQLDAVGAGAAEEIVCYCGGGISATTALFHLHRLGRCDIRLYDASMAEWAKDDELPIERG
jgi:thiosulfate/3-mercaptopyruvate sulfurtransferase